MYIAICYRGARHLGCLIQLRRPRPKGILEVTVDRVVGLAFSLTVSASALGREEGTHP